MSFIHAMGRGMRSRFGMKDNAGNIHHFGFLARQGHVTQAIQRMPLSPSMDKDPHLKITGIIGAPPAIFDTAQGSFLKVPMYYNKVANGNADIYQLEIYEGLAEEAQSLLTKGMQVHVGGRLRLDNYVDRNQIPRISPVIEVTELFIVEKSSTSSQDPVSPKPLQPSAPQQNQATTVGQKSSQKQVVTQPSVPHQQQQQQQPQQSQPQPSTPFARLTPEQEGGLWQQLLEDRSLFWDNRMNKRNERAPDFKHKETGAGLWLTSKWAPDWVHDHPW